MFRKTIIFSEIRGYPHSHASTVVALENGDLLAAWYSGDYEGAGNQSIFISRFVIREEIWTIPRIAAGTQGFPDGNPVLFLDRNSILWLYFVTMYGRGWDTCRVKRMFSQDQGNAWSHPEILINELGYMTRNKPIYARRTLVFPIYDERDWSSLFLLSEDGGRSWRFSEKIRSPGGCIQPAVVELSDGRLLAYMRTGGGGAALRSFSEDGGLSWTTPTRAGIKNPNSALDLVKVSSRALVVAYNDSTSRRTPLVVALSEDEGETWTCKRAIERGEGESSYPSLAKGSDGIIHMTYTYERRRIAHVCFDMEWLTGGP